MFIIIIIIGWLVNYVSCIVFVMFVLLLEIGYNIYLMSIWHQKMCSKNCFIQCFFFVLKESFCSQTYFSYPIYSITYIYVLRPLPTTKHSSRKKIDPSANTFWFSFQSEIFFFSSEMNTFPIWISYYLFESTGIMAIILQIKICKKKDKLENIAKPDV